MIKNVIAHQVSQIGGFISKVNEAGLTLQTPSAFLQITSNVYFPGGK